MLNKIKDFIYDKNDLLVALLVLVVAAVIIVWRMDILLAYPHQLFAENGGTQGTENPGVSVPGGADDQNEPGGAGGQDEPSDDAQNGENGEPGEPGQEPGADDQNGNGEPGEPTQPGESGQPGASLWNGDVLARDVEVNVTGYTATDAVGCLVEAGLFEDYSEYQTICGEIGLDHEKVKAGLMTFAEGSTKAEIARQINWS